MQEIYIGFWLAAMVILLAVEAMTQGLVCIWFAGGALAALLCAAFRMIFPVQLAVFFLVSGILLAFLLPLARKKLKKGYVATNADRIIGAEGVVTQDIDATEGTGQVRVMGTVWSAKEAHNARIPAGETVVVETIAGVKAVVKRKECEK